MPIRRPSTVLRRLLLIDAGTCAVMSGLLLLARVPVAALTAIPPLLLFYAGLALLPVSAFMATVATRAVISTALTRVIVTGNVLWVVGSLWLMFSGWIEPNAFGYLFIAGQAVVVAVLAGLEHAALDRVAGPASSA